MTVLQETARVHEAVNTQMQSMERPEQVNKLSPNDRQPKEKGTKGKKPGKESKCYRCGGTGHLAQDKSCPALDKTCNKCGKSGHFAACCKTKSTKKPSGRHRSEGANKVSEEKEEEDNYAFVLDTKSSNGSSGVVDLRVGGVQLKNVLIDSGATYNIVDRAAWESLKQKGVKCNPESVKRDCLLMAKPNQSRLLLLLKVKFIVKSLDRSVWMSLLLLKVVVKLCWERIKLRS